MVSQTGRIATNVEHFHQIQKSRPKVFAPHIMHPHHLRLLPCRDVVVGE